MLKHKCRKYGLEARNVKKKIGVLVHSHARTNECGKAKQNTDKPNETTGDFNTSLTFRMSGMKFPCPPCLRRQQRSGCEACWILWLQVLGLERRNVAGSLTTLDVSQCGRLGSSFYGPKGWNKDPYVAEIASSH